MCVIASKINVVNFLLESIAKINSQYGLWPAMALCIALFLSSINMFDPCGENWTTFP